MSTTQDKQKCKLTESLHLHLVTTSGLSIRLTTKTNSLIKESLNYQITKSNIRVYTLTKWRRQLHKVRNKGLKFKTTRRYTVYQQ